MKNKITVAGIMPGDPTGIGPEVTVKALAKLDLKDVSLLIVGDTRIIEMAQKQTGVTINFTLVEDAAEARRQAGIYLLDTRNMDPSKIKQGQVSGYSGSVTGDTLVKCINLLKEGDIDGLTFAALNKTALKEGGYKFEDEHRMFAHYLDWTGRVCEINVLDDLFTTRVTSHIPLSEVTSNITPDKIVANIELLYDTLRETGLAEPRIAVAALNPHAGDYGACGREEIDIIEPAVQKAKSEGKNAKGPLAADTLFIQAMKKKLYDGVVTMYHDQGQIALKTQGFERCVTVSGGLPYPITTPAQGTAFDIVGQNLASPEAFVKALEIVLKMIKTRNARF